MDKGFKSEFSELVWNMYKIDPIKNFNYLSLYLAVEYADELENIKDEGFEL